MSKQVKRVQPTLYLKPTLKQLELESSLKALLAIQAAGIDVKQSNTKYDHFAENVILDLPEQNLVLFETSAIVKYLLKDKINNLNAKDLATVNSWVEYDEFTLSKLLSKDSTESPDAALEKIENTLKTNNKQLGKVSSELADIAIFSSIYVGLSYKKYDISKYPTIKEWMNEKLQNQADIYVSATRKWGRIMGFPAEQKIDTKNSIVLDHHERVILPVEGKRNILVTSALPYVNNVPHLGNIIGAMLSADVFSRYCRMRDYNIIFINGTDEYGTATETKALEEKCTCQALCDKYHALHKEVYKWFGIDFDYFGRTTTPQQTEIAQDIFLKLHKNGYLLEDTVTQLYCNTCKLFLADRFVEGECPFCHYDDARGDQCDKCGKLINAVELIKPRCKVCSSTPETKTSNHIFIDLPKLQDKCAEFVKKNSVEGEWSSNSISITNGWLKEGLKPRCITRDLKWGTPVPLEHMKDKVFYVWFDAPIGYISMTACYTPEWKKWWMNPEQVQLYQFMGKDNIPFHTVIFPCSEIGTGDNYTLLNRLSTTEYLNYENGKFSKSRNVGVFGNNAVDTGVPVEVWRYYLLINRPENNDSSFTWNDFIARNNNELLNNIGNFVNRLLKFVAAKYDSIIPNYDLSGPVEQKLIEDVNKLLKEYISNMEACKLRAGLKIAMDISQVGNAYLQENKIDNKLFTEKRQICDNVVSASVNLIYLLSSLFYPYMPTTTESILKQINAPLRKIADVWEANEILPGHTIGKPAYLFKRIDPEMENVWREKYGGNTPKEAKDSKPAAKKQKKSQAANEKKPAANDKKPAANEKKQAAKEKKEKKEKKPAAAAAPAAETGPDPSKLDIRVGHIIEARKHEQADSLYVESIDVGEAEPRTVVSGLVKFMTVDQLINRDVVVLCNLKPVSMRGIKSHAMVLCATSPDGTKVEFVSPPAGSKPGDRVVIGSYDGTPEKQLNPKKKIFESIQPGFKTTETNECVWIAQDNSVHKFNVNGGVCKVDSIVGGGIR